MSRLIIPILLVVALFLFVAKVHISFNPLSISLERPLLAAGYVLLGIGLSIIAGTSYRDGFRKGSTIKSETSYLKGYRDGLNKAYDMFEETINECLKGHRDSMSKANDEFEIAVNEYLKKHKKDEKDTIQ